MIQVFDREQYYEDMAIMEAQYLEQFGFIPVDESDYEDLKSLFDDFKYKCFNNESIAAFVDYGYVPF